MRIVFFGTPHFAATCLDTLLQHGVNVVACVTKPDKPVGRSGQLQPPPVKVLAERKGIPLYQPKKASHPDFEAVLASCKADLFVVVAYSEILKENILALPPHGCVNVHASLLPKYRGAAPIHRAVMAGEKESGVTIMMMVKELDAGDMLSVAKVPISEEMTTGELFEALSHVGAKELYKVIQQFEQGTVQKTPQDSTQVTFAAKVTPEEAEIDWNLPAHTLHNHIRGLTPKPGAWCKVLFRGESKRFLVKKAKLAPFHQGPAGHILPTEGLVVACGQGALELFEVQLEGKKSLPIHDFLRGVLKSELSFVLK